MRRKGFTLVELLAVIVILAVVSMVATPMVLNVIEKVKKSAFEQTIKGVLESASLYQIETEITEPITNCRYFSFSSDVESIIVRDNKTYYPLSKLKLKGKVPTEGEIKVCSEEIKIEASNGEYSIAGDMDNLNISKGDLSSNDLETPVIDVFNIKATIDSLMVIVSAHSPSVGGVITNYYYKIDKGEYIKTSEKVYTFEKLKANEEYEISVKVENKSGITKEESKKVKTNEFGEITVNVSDSDKWTTSKTVEITGTTNEYEIEYKIKKYNFDTKSEEETTYAKYIDKIEISDMATEEHPVVIVARYKSGENVSNQKDKNIVNIDNSKPNINLLSGTSTTNSIVLNIETSDIESGIKSTTCEYGKDTNYGLLGTVKDNKCTITNLESSETYYYKITTTNNSGLSSDIKGNTETGSIVAPTFTYINTPNMSYDDYLSKQEIKVKYNTSNVTTPIRYIKTTKEGTINLEVLESCGTNILPDLCTSISSTTNLSENTWYKVSDDISITYKNTQTTMGTLYAVLYDGTNYSNSATATINKIDASEPTNVTLVSNSTSTSSVSLTAECKDTESGVSKIELSKDGGTTYEAYSMIGSLWQWEKYGIGYGNGTISSNDEYENKGLIKKYTFSVDNNKIEGLFYNNIPSELLTEGTKYKWSVYLKGSENMTAKVGQEQGGTKNVQVETNWQKFTYTYTAKNDKRYHAFVIYNFPNNYTLYLHSLSIMEADTINLSGTYQYEFSGLESNTSYNFKARCTNNVGIESESSVLTVSTN